MIQALWKPTQRKSLSAISLTNTNTIRDKDPVTIWRPYNVSMDWEPLQFRPSVESETKHISYTSKRRPVRFRNPLLTSLTDRLYFLSVILNKEVLHFCSVVANKCISSFCTPLYWQKKPMSLYARTCPLQTKSSKNVSFFLRHVRKQEIENRFINLNKVHRGYLLKYDNIFQFWLNSDDSNENFTWKPMCGWMVGESPAGESSVKESQPGNPQ